MSSRSGTVWRTIYVTPRGKKVRRRVKSMVCLWWHVAKEHPIKVVIVKNPSPTFARNQKNMWPNRVGASALRLCASNVL